MGRGLTFGQPSEGIRDHLHGLNVQGDQALLGLQSRTSQVHRKVTDLQTALADPRTQSEALEILRSLIERVVLHPADKGFEIELIGEIANMVELGTQNQKAAPGGAAVPEVYRNSVKVVAGTCNPRQLTLPPIAV